MGEKNGTQGLNWSEYSIGIVVGYLIRLSIYHVTTVHLNWKW